MELRSTLKTTKTDSSGGFVFTEVEPGKHSLTALSDGKVIGYLSFTLQKDNQTDVVLLEDGTYTVSVAEDSAGVELHLELDEEKGTLAPTNVITVSKPSSPQTGDDTSLSWWWLILVLSVVCIVVIEILRRKKTVK